MYFPGCRGCGYNRSFHCFTTKISCEDVCICVDYSCLYIDNGLTPKKVVLELINLRQVGNYLPSRFSSLFICLTFHVLVPIGPLLTFYGITLSFLVGNCMDCLHVQFIVYGDFEVIIKWVKVLYNLQVLQLDHQWLRIKKHVGRISRYLIFTSLQNF